MSQYFSVHIRRKLRNHLHLGNTYVQKFVPVFSLLRDANQPLILILRVLKSAAADVPGSEPAQEMESLLPFGIIPTRQKKFPKES